MTTKIKIMGAVFAVALLMGGAAILYAANEETVIEGYVQYATEPDGKSLVVTDLVPKEEWDSYKAEYNLRITKRGHVYYWASNGDKPLIRIEKEEPSRYKDNQKYTVFLNPDGDGQIIIQHSELDKDGCFKGLTNYYEYRRSNAWFKKFSGRTNPYPYPIPNGEHCKRWR